MHELMLGMFWGGLVMAIPPILVGAAIVVLLIQQRREERESVERQAGPDR